MLSLPILFKYVLLFLSFSYISTFFTPTYKTPSFYLSSSISYFLSLFYSSPSPTYLLLSTLSFYPYFVPLCLPLPHGLHLPFYHLIHLYPLTLLLLFLFLLHISHFPILLTHTFLTIILTRTTGAK